MDLRLVKRVNLIKRLIICVLGPQAQQKHLYPFN